MGQGVAQAGSEVLAPGVSGLYISDSCQPHRLGYQELPSSGLWVTVGRTPIFQEDLGKTDREASLEQQGASWSPVNVLARDLWEAETGRV